MEPKFFTKTFFKFFFGFAAIIAVAFGVFITFGVMEQAQPVDNVALPQ